MGSEKAVAIGLAIGITLGATSGAFFHRATIEEQGRLEQMIVEQSCAKTVSEKLHKKWGPPPFDENKSALQIRFIEHCMNGLGYETGISTLVGGR